MEYPSDEELLQQFKSGTNENYALNLIIKKYQQRVYLHIRRLVISHDDADELVQLTFIKVWKGLKNFREDSQLFTWIYRIATNECLTFLKQKRKRFFFPIVDVEQELSQQLSSDPAFSSDSIELKLHKAILTLPEKQRIVFNLRYYDEMKYEKMSEILNTSVGALKASYHHAATKIEEYLKAN